ncbi:MAG: hypothetical protein B6247_23700 [Candidatus Parabeggiatoa sp. nov. 2]|nr:MAG: hypothetical protein B6247_23700 [Beggiatoa sp. 4572_84]
MQTKRLKDDYISVRKKRLAYFGVDGLLTGDLLNNQLFQLRDSLSLFRLRKYSGHYPIFNCDNT